MDKEEQTALISHLVDKVTKGVKKQIKGYVSSISREIQSEKKMVDYLCNEFKDTYRKTQLIRADMTALDFMLREHNDNKLFLQSMRECMTQINNKLLDINLLKGELENEIKILRKFSSKMKKD